MEEKVELHPNQEIIELLKEIDMFSELNDPERSDLAALFDSKTYESGKELFQEDDPGGMMYIIAEGTVEVQKRRSHGTGRVVIARFDRGGVIGEMSLIDGMPRSATVIAVQTTRSYVLSQETFDEMIANNQDLAVKILKGLAKLLSLRLRNTSGWFADVF